MSTFQEWASHNMQRLDLAWFVRLGGSLRSFLEGDLEDLEIAVPTLREVIGHLIYLGDRSRLPLSLDASQSVVWDIINMSLEILNETDETVRGELLDKRKDRLYEQGHKLSTLLDADLAHQLVFLLEPKRAYDVSLLVADGTRLFSDEVRQSLTDEESYNLTEAAKCLAFEIPTGAGFHIFRGAEGVLRRYYAIVVGSLPTVKSRNWGAYLRVLQKQPKADPKILVVLRQIKDLYRNPIIHPETKLTMEAALSLIGLVETLLSLLVAEINRLAPPPAPPLLPGLGGGQP
jgi:hypothetical protein